MHMLLRAGFGIGGAQMKRRMSVAVRERKRQEHQQAADERRPDHGNEYAAPAGLKVLHLPDSTTQLLR